MQELLSKKGFVDSLQQLFPYIEWRYTQTESTNMHQNPSGSSDLAMKIQYLRLLHNYCARDADNFKNKVNFISSDEIKIFLM